jgi:hypothetical protein
MGDCFLWAVVWRLQLVLCYFLPNRRLFINFVTRVGLHFGLFSHKLIWSPGSQICLSTRRHQKYTKCWEEYTVKKNFRKWFFFAFKMHLATTYIHTCCVVFFNRSWRCNSRL